MSRNSEEDYLLDRLRYHEKVDMEKVMKAAAKIKENEAEKEKQKNIIIWEAIPNPFEDNPQQNA